MLPDPNNLLFEDFIYLLEGEERFMAYRVVGILKQFGAGFDCVCYEECLQALPEPVVGFVRAHLAKIDVDRWRHRIINEDLLYIDDMTERGNDNDN